VYPGTVDAGKQQLRETELVWGAVTIYREPGRPLFDADELRFVQVVSTYLAAGARRALLVGQALEAEVPDAPGLVCSARHGRWNRQRRRRSIGWPIFPTGTGIGADCPGQCTLDTRQNVGPAA
jgi:hypothetical protein